MTGLRHSICHACERLEKTLLQLWWLMHLGWQEPAGFLFNDKEGAMMLDQNFANHFASDWIAAWNSRDLPRVLAHYADDFEMSSPLIVKLAGEPSGTLKGKQQVGAYWSKALGLLPDLHFDLLEVLLGVDSITLHYQSNRGRAAEVLHFGPDRLVARAFAHYGV